MLCNDLHSFRLLIVCFLVAFLGKKKKTSAAHCVLCCHPRWLCVGTCGFSLVLMNKHHRPDFLARLLYEINKCKFKNKQLKAHIFTFRSVISPALGLELVGVHGRSHTRPKKDSQQHKWTGSLFVTVKLKVQLNYRTLDCWILYKKYPHVVF